MTQRGGDAATKKQLEIEKKPVLEYIKDTPQLPVSIRSAAHIISGYGKNDPKGNLDQLRNYKQRLLNYFKGKYPNKKNMSLNDFFKYEKNMRSATMKQGGKRKTRREKKSKRATRRRR